MSPKINSGLEPKITPLKVQDQALSIANYMLSLDNNREKKLFSTEKINSLLNKMLHLVNILHCAKFGEEIFSETPMLTENGVIISSVHEIYSKKALQSLGKQRNDFFYPFFSDYLPEQKKELVRNFFNYFIQYEEWQLIEFSKEDVARQKARKNKELYLSIDEKTISYYQTFYQHVVEEIEIFSNN